MKSNDSQNLGILYEEILSCCPERKEKEVTEDEIELRKELLAYTEEMREYINAVDHPNSLSMLCQVMENINNTFRKLLKQCNHDL